MPTVAMIMGKTEHNALLFHRLLRLTWKCES